MHRRDLLRTTAAFAVSPAFVTKRPRLYFTAAFAAAMQKDRPLLIERAKRLLDASPVPESVAEQGGGQHANYGRPSGQISDMGLILGLAHHATSDKQYAAKLREIMLAYAAYQRWGGQGLSDRRPPWHSELNTARFCFGYGVGYDAIHHFLSPEERATIAASMVRNGIRPTLDDWVLPDKRIHALDSMGHNWWSVCVSMAGVACLSLLGDEPQAPAWIDAIHSGLALWFNYRGSILQNKTANFDRAGAFYEGVGYAHYALSEYLRYRLAYANVYPGRPQPRFSPLGQSHDFFLHTLYPTAQGFLTLNIGDGSLHVNASGTVRLLEETGFSHANSSWYLAKVASTAPADPLSFVARKPLSAPQPPRLANSVLYPDIGWAILRSSWKDDATLLAVRSGFTWNHVHADAGSFLLFHKGVPLLTDSGTCSYSDPEYGNYYVQSRAHNVVLFNGEGQPREDIRRGVKTPGSVHSLLDGAGLRYVYADATGPMSRYFSRNYRHFLWIGGAILIFDDIRAHEEGRLDWLLHYEGKADLTGQRVAIRNQDSRAEVRFLFPGSLQVRQEMGLADHRPKQPVPHLVFSPPSPVREQKFIAAVLPDGLGETEFENLTSPDALGVRVKQASETTDVWLNLNADGRRMHENTNNTIDGFDTDAYLFALTRSQSGTRCLVSSASYLRKGGTILLDSLSKVDAVWRTAGSAEVYLQGQPEIEASIAVPGEPRAFRLNGKAAKSRFDAVKKRLHFRVP